MAFKFIGIEQLKYFHTKLKELVVLKEHKTGSEDEWKVLSDNNLTDALVEKINSSAGSSYNSLTDKPQIDSIELSTTTTSTELGLAKKTELPQVATTGVAGLVKPDGTTITVDEGGQISVNELSSYLTKSEASSTYETTDHASTTYQTKEDMSDYLESSAAESTYATKVELDNYAKSEKVTSDINAAKLEMEGKIDAAVAGVYTPKGSTTFDSLPEPSEETLGDVYNVTDSFTISETADKWVEGASGPYPANTNVVVVQVDEDYKWDVIGGVVDLTGYLTSDALNDYVQTSTLDNYLQKSEAEATYVKTADCSYVSNEEIDAIFSPVI